jgi:hypothetical protein
MTNYLWLLVVAGGPALIALAIAYAMIRNRRLTPREKQAQHQAVERMYHEDDSEETRPSVR